MMKNLTEVRTEVDEQYGIVVMSNGETWEQLNDEVSVVYLTKKAFEEICSVDGIRILEDREVMEEEINEEPILMTITIRELIDFWKERR